jgi:hypothetical protein
LYSCFEIRTEGNQDMADPLLELNHGGAIFPSPDHEDWKALYEAAILEANKNAILQKVSKAEQAVLARARALFHTAGTREEKEPL